MILYQELAEPPYLPPPVATVGTGVLKVKVDGVWIPVNVGGTVPHHATHEPGGADALELTAASRLLGRGSAGGAGPVQEIGIGSGLVMTGTTLSAGALRNVPRVQSIVSSAAIRPNLETADAVVVTALAEPTTIHAPLGMPFDTEMLLLRLRDDGRRHRLTWDSGYSAGGAALPAFTGAAKTLYLTFRYNAQSAKWVLLEVVREP